MGSHSNIPAWETPRSEEPGGLQSMGSQRVRHNLATKQLSTLSARALSTLIIVGQTPCLIIPTHLSCLVMMFALSLQIVYFVF